MPDVLVMTATPIPRTAALAARGETFDVVVMVQGDEPMTDPRQIEEVLQPFADPTVQVSRCPTNRQQKTHHRHVGGAYVLEARPGVEPG